MARRVLIVSAFALAAGMAAAAPADDLAGRYIAKSGPYDYSLTIKPKGTGAYHVQVEVASQKPACMGDFEADARLSGGKLMTIPEDGDECVFTITRTPNGARAVGTPGCETWHGAACQFADAYAKAGPAPARAPRRR